MLTRRQAAQGDRPRPPPPPPPRPLPAGVRPRRGGTLVSPRGRQDATGADSEEYEFVEQHPDTVNAPEQAQQDRDARAEDQSPLAVRIERAVQADEMQLREEEPQPAPVQRVEQSSQTNLESDWILRVRLPAPMIQPQKPRRPNDPPMRIIPKIGPLVSIHVPVFMTVDSLSACLLQAVLHHPGAASSSMPVLDTRENKFVGLFAEQSGVFFSLEHILARTSTQERRQVFCTHLPPPPPPPPPPPTPWYLMWEVWLAVSIPILISLIVNHLDTIIQVSLMTSAWMYQAAIQIPLQELYRHGPWFLGWEGASLPHICARITYHGDAEFWSRNIEECNRIFSAKEEAWLRLARPFLWGLIFLGIVLVFRLIVWEFFSKPPPQFPPAQPIDRDMVETYTAWQTLLRQMQRTLAPPSAPQSQFQSQQQQQFQTQQQARVRQQQQQRMQQNARTARR